MSRRSPLVAVLAVAAICTSACTGSVEGAPVGVSASSVVRTPGTGSATDAAGTPSTDATTPGPTKNTPAKPAAPQKVWQRLWQKQDNPALGQPVAVGKYAVLFTSTHDVPYLDIVDPASGRSLWRMPTGGWWSSGAKDFQPAVIGTKIAFTQTDQLALSSTRVGIVDVTTRKVVYSSPVKGALSRIWPCGTTFCVGETVDDLDRLATVDPRTARITVATALGSGGHASIDNSGLVTIVRKGAPTQLAMLRNGRVLWKRPANSVLGIAIEDGSALHATYLAQERLIVGSIDRVAADGRISQQSRTFAVDAATGRRLWVNTAVMKFCFDPLGLGAVERAKLVCGFSKDTRYNSRAQKFRAGRLDVATLDLKTGRPQRTVALGPLARKSFDDIGNQVRAIDAHSVLAQAGPGTVLDVEHGTQQPAKSEKVLCDRVIDALAWGASSDVVGEKPLRATGFAVGICDANGTRAPQTATLPSTVGATIGSTQLFTTGQTLVAGTVTTEKVKTRTIAAAAETASPTRLPVTAATAPQWTAKGFTAASQPVLAGDRALVYGTLRGTFSLIAVDVKSGRLKWSTPASLAGVTGGLHRPAVVGRRALVMVPVPGYTLVRPSIVDTQTGRVLVRPALELILRSPLERCGDLVCTVLGLPGGGFVSAHIDLQSGSMSIDPTQKGHTTMRAVAPDVYATQDGTTQRLFGSSRGWHRFAVPAATIVPAGRVLSASQAPAVDGVYVRSLGIAVRSDGNYPLLKRGRDIGLVGISASTGKRVWALRGSDRDCFGVSVSDGGAPIVCSWGAAATSQYSDQGATHSGLNVSVQGFDPRTGTLSRWKVPLTTGAGVQTSGTFGMADETHVIVPGPKGPISIDVNTGRTVGVTKGTPRLCGKTVEAETGNVAYNSAGSEETSWSVGESWSWCDEDDDPVTATKSWPSWIGAHAPAMTIVLTAAGLQGFPRS